MAPGAVTTEEIAMVREALVRLRGLKPFRGQPLLVRDVEEHLAAMVAAQSAGRGEPNRLPGPSGGQPRVTPPNVEGA